MKKLGTIFLTFLLINIGIGIFNNVAYAQSYDEEKANVLKELGLFCGTGAGFELDQPCDRLMGAVILTRFLGYEEDALNSSYPHPYLDTLGTYADPYVGFLYEKGMIQGVTSTSYGTGTMTSNQFATLMLRVLGYIDNEDFSWDEALQKMGDLNIISGDDVSRLDKSEFVRDDAVFLCYRTLFALPKSQNKSLANKLLWEDVFSTDQLGATLDGKLMLAADMPDIIPYDTKVSNLDELKKIILLSMKNNQLGAGFKVENATEEELMNAYEEFISQYHWKAVLAPTVSYCWDGYIQPHIGISDYLMMEFYYEDPDRYEKNYQFYRTDLFSIGDDYRDFAEWTIKISEISNQIIKDEMNQEEKIRAIHDYLVLNTKYEKEIEGGFYAIHFAEQIIFDGEGVCDGYAEAFKILANAAGFECNVVYGNTPYGGHAWNQIKVDGKWYNMDVTWDDPDSGKRISYTYYCRGDKFFNEEHWVEEGCLTYDCAEDL